MLKKAIVGIIVGSIVLTSSAGAIYASQKPKNVEGSRQQYNYAEKFNNNDNGTCIQNNENCTNQNQNQNCNTNCNENQNSYGKSSDNGNSNCSRFRSEDKNQNNIRNCFNIKVQNGKNK